jgi:hypothetical protein
MDEKPEDPQVVRVAEAIVRAKFGDYNAKALIPKEEPPPRPGERVQRHPPRGEWTTALRDARIFVAALKAAEG